MGISLLFIETNFNSLYFYRVFEQRMHFLKWIVCSKDSHDKSDLMRFGVISSALSVVIFPPDFFPGKREKLIFFPGNPGKRREKLILL